MPELMKLDADRNPGPLSIADASTPPMTIVGGTIEGAGLVPSV